jgi:hypothetical protein
MERLSAEPPLHAERNLMAHDFASCRAKPLSRLLPCKFNAFRQAQSKGKCISWTYKQPVTLRKFECSATHPSKKAKRARQWRASLGQSRPGNLELELPGLENLNPGGIGFF